MFEDDTKFTKRSRRDTDDKGPSLPDADTVPLTDTVSETDTASLADTAPISDTPDVLSTDDGANAAKLPDDTSLNLDDANINITSKADKIGDADGGGVGASVLSSAESDNKDDKNSGITGSDTKGDIDVSGANGDNVGSDVIGSIDGNNTKGDTSAGRDSDDSSGEDDDVTKGVIGYYSAVDNDVEGRDDDNDFYYGGSTSNGRFGTWVGTFSLRYFKAAW